ncbi:hypothetical protein DIKCMJMK_00421 [Shewanella oneidensis]|nr:hypothetical protein [Shewanella oneidensis]
MPPAKIEANWPYRALSKMHNIKSHLCLITVVSTKRVKVNVNKAINAQLADC